jgi:hypothetical protein
MKIDARTAPRKAALSATAAKIVAGAAMLPNHDIGTLRAVLCELPVSDIQEGDLPPKDAAVIAELFRDVRLELTRAGGIEFSDDQLHRLQQMEYRLQMVATRHAEPSSIADEARRALAAFGWTGEKVWQRVLTCTLIHAPPSEQWQRHPCVPEVADNGICTYVS